MSQILQFAGLIFLSNQ